MNKGIAQQLENLAAMHEFAAHMPHDSLRTRGNCKPTGFTEYDSLTGYVDRTYTTTWHDAEGNLWRKTCVIINLGRPDRGTPVDPDAQLTEERLPQERKDPRILQAKRAGELSEAVSAYLREHGPTGIARLYMDLHVGRDKLHAHLRLHSGTLYTYYGTKRRVWGIKEAV